MRILVAVDLGVMNHDILLARTDRFARRTGGVVDLVYVRKADATLAEIDHFETRLKSLLAIVEPARQGVARLEVGGVVEDALVEVSVGYDVVVVGPREPSALERLIHGVMSVRVLTKAHCPVLVPRGEGVWSDPPRMAVGVDVHGTVQDLLVEKAAEWAANLGAVLDLVHAVAERLPTIRDASVAERAEKEWLARHEAEVQALEALLTHIPKKNRGVGVLKRGEPEMVLVAVSAEYDLIAVGNRDRAGLAGLILGAVARPVVRRAHCDVLTLNTADVTPT